MDSIKCNSGDKKLNEKVNEWLNWDRNPKTRKEIITAIEKEEWSELKKALLGRIKFGTAGLRGAMKAGFCFMNDVIVLQTAQGICEYLKKSSPELLKNGVAVGFDGRYNSKRFAELTAKVFVSSSVKVYLFSNVCPTPFIPFATLKYGCATGIMVTASHNPKEDNGYKVYWHNGSQIICPHDENILNSILQNLNIPEEHWDIKNVHSNKLVVDPLAEITTDYTAYIHNSLSQEVLARNAELGLPIVYSAMHGVGYPFVEKAFQAAQLKAPIVVAEQRDPDPEFSTVVFPNPEELECLQLSMALADKHRVQLVLVNDPDADRLAVAEYQKSEKKWKIFSGNEIGALLGWWLVREHRLRCGDTAHVYLLASVVSSKLLRAIAQQEGCHFLQTLTGFKWMGNKTHLLKKQNKQPIFAFEEAIGYMCSSRVPDKDGVSAAVQVASLASFLRQTENRSLNEHMSWLYAQYGYHVCYNAYYICHNQDTIRDIFRRIRTLDYPLSIPVGDCKIVTVRDLSGGLQVPAADQHQADGQTDDIEGTGMDLAYTGGEMIMFNCDNGLDVTIRTSGTEPKIKYYTELVTTAHTKQDQERVKSSLKDMVDTLIDILLQPKYNKLQ